MRIIIGKVKGIVIGIRQRYRKSNRNSNMNKYRSTYKSNYRNGYRENSIDTFSGFGQNLSPNRFLFKRLKPKAKKHLLFGDCQLTEPRLQIQLIQSLLTHYLGMLVPPLVTPVPPITQLIAIHGELKP